MLTERLVNLSLQFWFEAARWASAGTCGFRLSVCGAGAALNDMLHREATRQLVAASSWEPAEAKFWVRDFVGGCVWGVLMIYLPPCLFAFPLKFCNYFCVCHPPFVCECIQRSVAVWVGFCLFVCGGKPTSSCRWWGLEGF